MTPLGRARGFGGIAADFEQYRVEIKIGKKRLLLS
jgi:hypothetical protein